MLFFFLKTAYRWNIWPDMRDYLVSGDISDFKWTIWINERLASVWLLGRPVDSFTESCNPS